MDHTRNWSKESPGNFETSPFSKPSILTGPTYLTVMRVQRKYDETPAHDTWRPCPFPAMLLLRGY